MGGNRLRALVIEDGRLAGSTISSASARAMPRQRLYAFRGGAARAHWQDAGDEFVFARPVMNLFHCRNPIHA